MMKARTGSTGSRCSVSGWPLWPNFSLPQKMIDLKWKYIKAWIWLKATKAFHWCCERVALDLPTILSKLRDNYCNGPYAYYKASFYRAG